jgi:hypothetical protein
MKTTPAQSLALSILRDNPDGLSCVDLGVMMFKREGQYLPGRSTSSNRWARSAGKVLKALAARSLVRCRVVGNRMVWRVNP